MITLTGGQFQDASGNLLKKGYLSLQLTSDAAIIAGGQVIRAIPLSFPIVNGSLSSSVKVYSNAELSGSTQYFALVLDANQKRVGDPAIWQFTQGSGATVDVGTIVTVTGGASFPAPVLLNPTAQQKIANFNLELAKALVLDGSSSGSSVLQAPATAGATNTLPQGAGILAALSLAQIWTAIQQFNLGITLTKSDGTLPASIVNDTSGGVNITSNGNKTWEFANAGTLVSPAVTTPLQLQGSTSGFVQIVVPAVAGSSVLTLPAATGTLALGIPSKQIFTGNGTFTIPTGVTAVKVTLIGGGGGGGGSTATNNGGGGGSGGAAIKWLTGLTPGNTLAVTIGGAGTAGTTGAAGGSGGNSTIASGTQTITTVTAFGGGGGNGNGAQSTGGSGGAIGTNGDLNLGGVSGFDGFGISGGPGGGSMLGGGAPSSNGGLAGNPATSFGGGGGGAGSGGNRSGGAGAAGLVVFEWVT